MKVDARESNIDRLVSLVVIWFVTFSIALLFMLAFL